MSRERQETKGTEYSISENCTRIVLELPQRRERERLSGHYEAFSNIQFESASSNSDEYNFWAKFFEIIDHELEEEFRESVRREGAFISWDFWVENKGDKKEQYREVLRKATTVIKHQHIDWEVDNVEDLLTLAQNVRNERRRKLNRSATSYEAHLEVFQLWYSLTNAIEDLLTSLRSRIVRRVETNRRIGLNDGNTSNKPNGNNDGPGIGLGILGGLGALAAGAYLAYKIFGDSEEQMHKGQQNSRPTAGQINRANQCNPNHKPTGPGRPAGYPGLGTKADLDNHANQLNPNNPKF